MRTSGICEITKVVGVALVFIVVNVKMNPATSKLGTSCCRNRRALGRKQRAGSNKVYSSLSDLMF